jgi:hypothetical protein
MYVEQRFSFSRYDIYISERSLLGQKKVHLTQSNVFLLVTLESSGSFRRADKYPDTRIGKILRSRV